MTTSNRRVIGVLAGVVLTSGGAIYWLARQAGPRSSDFGTGEGLQSRRTGPELQGMADPPSRPGGDAPLPPEDVLTGSSVTHHVSKVNWAAHAHFFSAWSDLIDTGSSDDVLNKDPKLLRSMVAVLGDMSDAYPGQTMDDLRTMLKRPLMQAELLTSLAGRCADRRDPEAVSRFEQQIARVEEQEGARYHGTYEELHAARLDLYLRARASLPDSCRTAFERSARSVLFGFDSDLVVMTVAQSGEEEAVRLVVQMWTQMYGVTFPKQEVQESLDLARKWWNEGSGVVSRMRRDYGDVVSLSLTSRGRAWAEHGAESTLAILRVRKEMAILQDQYERRLGERLETEARKRVEGLRPTQLLIVGRPQ